MHRRRTRLPLIWCLGFLAWGGLASAQPKVAPPACAIAAGAATLDDGVVHYSRAGHGPAVLLLHGLFAQKEQWHDLLCTLAAAGFDAVAPDLPGFGASADFPVNDYDLVRQADLLHAFVGTLGLTDIALAANSMGGTIAALYVERHPHEVRRLAFIGPPLGVVDWSPGVRQAIQKGVNPFIPIDPEQFDLELRLLFAAPPAVPERIREALLKDYVTRNRHYQQVWDIVNLYGRALDRPPRLPPQVLILWGEADGVFAVAGAESLHQRLPGSALVTLPGAGHLPMLERPTETAGALIPFLRERPGPQHGH
ncbi:alpha/beta hydrolase [uncultured Thiodictyon sp.]|uniref:alpha/beta fold hydrolase n=1 Tax=uncultured Thiodictyon sp. TaxID=1846217 RepID=UPI0025FA9040|nr:alpha/beta hydrolase [uncultured Thiodictyon sp.]